MTTCKDFNHPDAIRERERIDAALLAFTEELRATLYEKAAERNWSPDWRDAAWTREEMEEKLRDRVSRGHPIYAACYLLFLHAKEARDPLDPAYTQDLRPAYRWRFWRRVPTNGGYAFAIGVPLSWCPWRGGTPDCVRWRTDWQLAASRIDA
jgi:hypothetical protein